MSIASVVVVLEVLVVLVSGVVDSLMDFREQGYVNWLLTISKMTE